MTTTPRKSPRVRHLLAGILVAVGVVLVPLALIGGGGGGSDWLPGLSAQSTMSTLEATNINIAAQLPDTMKPLSDEGLKNDGKEGNPTKSNPAPGGNLDLDLGLVQDWMGGDEGEKGKPSSFDAGFENDWITDSPSAFAGASFGPGGPTSFDDVAKRRLTTLDVEGLVKYPKPIVGKGRTISLTNLPNVSARGNPRSKPFRFHIYRIPDRYITGALKLLEERWPTSYCNRVKTNYTMLDWRHAHSLFTVDIFIAKYLRLHPNHTDDPNEADIFIIPMMTHLYNCAGIHHYTIEILQWVTQFPYYKLMNQHDHYLFWWRWGMHYNSVLRFWKRVQKHFPNINLISFDYLEIMGRNEWQDFSLALKPKFLQYMHHVVVPYPDFSPHLSVPLTAAELARPRDIFFYFSGTSNIGGIRRWIKRACDASPNDCVYEEFAKNVIDHKRVGVPTSYPEQMKKSVFCGHAAGDALSSRRPTSAVLAGCIPVLICDLCLYAWENLIDYQSFAIFLHEDDVMNGQMLKILRSIPQETIQIMQRNLLEVRQYFVYNTIGAPGSGDALDTLVTQLALRGSILRQYRRWWYYNDQLSVEAKDYPIEPKAVKRYLKKGSSTAKEEKDFNNLN
jgi:hypothetical protein